MAPSFNHLAVAYIRMSSDDQDRSPKQQRSQILALAAKRNLTIVRWYEDLGISGDDIKRRKSFRQMVADASSKGDFKWILCWSQDRFGRFDSLEAGEWVTPLRRAGVCLVTVAEGEIDWTEAAGRIVYTIQQEGKNAFLLDLARNTTRGRLEAAKRIGFVGGLPPYGYDRIIVDDRGKFHRRVLRHEFFRTPPDWTARIVPSKTESVVVKRIFAEYARGKSALSIASDLNRRGIPSPGRKAWYLITIRNILRNPVYVGDQVWNRRHSGKYFSIVGTEVVTEKLRCKKHGERTTNACMNPPEEWVVIPNAHPAIVSRRTFLQAQSRIKQRRGRNYQCPGLPLTGLLRCGHCGSKMTHRVRRFQYNGSEYRYWIILCPTPIRNGGQLCKYRTASEAQIREFVVSRLSDLIGDGFEQTLRKQLCDDLSGKYAPKSRGKLQRRADQLARKIEKGAENLLLARRTDLQAATARLDGWQNELLETHLQIAAIDEGSPANIEKSVAMTMSEIRRLRFGLRSKDRALLHHTLQRLLSQVTLVFEPDPRKPGCGRLKEGIIEARTPYLGERTTPVNLSFTRDELERQVPRSNFWRVRKKVIKRPLPGRSKVRATSRFSQLHSELPALR